MPDFAGTATFSHEPKSSLMKFKLTSPCPSTAKVWCNYIASPDVTHGKLSHDQHIEECPCPYQVLLPRLSGQEGLL